jgi:large subunit ribosomal protein L17
MRHLVRGRKLGRTTAHREALFRNQLQSLMARERIVTTLPKAKELRPLAEKVITHGKHGTVHARRWVLRWIPDRDLVKKVFDDIGPRFRERPGGYLRIVKLGPRQGDGAEMAVIELVDRVETAAPAAKPGKKAKKAKGKAKRGAARPAAGEAGAMAAQAAEEREDAAAEAQPARAPKKAKRPKAKAEAAAKPAAGKAKPKPASEKDEQPAPKSKLGGLLRRRKKEEEE